MVSLADPTPLTPAMVADVATAVADGYFDDGRAAAAIRGLLATVRAREAEVAAQKAHTEIWIDGYNDARTEALRLRAEVERLTVERNKALAWRRCADALADEVAVLVRRKIVDSRSPVADALLDYMEPPSSPRSERLAALETEVERLTRELAEERRHFLADEERRKLMGDALYAEGQNARLARRVERLTTALRAIRDETAEKYSPSWEVARATLAEETDDG